MILVESQSIFKMTRNEADLNHDKSNIRMYIRSTCRKDHIDDNFLFMKFLQSCWFIIAIFILLKFSLFKVNLFALILVLILHK